MNKGAPTEMWIGGSIRETRLLKPNTWGIRPVKCGRQKKKKISQSNAKSLSMTLPEKKKKHADFAEQKPPGLSPVSTCFLNLASSSRARLVPCALTIVRDVSRWPGVLTDSEEEKFSLPPQYIQCVLINVSGQQIALSELSKCSSMDIQLA